MNATQKYELIRPILKGEKTPKQINRETGIPLNTIYYYLRRFREGGNIESLTDRFHANKSHPKWLTQADKEKVIQYKLQHPHLSSRQIAENLVWEGDLQIRYRTVVNVLKEYSLPPPFFSTNHTN